MIIDRDALNQIARNHEVEIRLLYAEIERLKAGLAQIEKSYPRATTTALRRMARAALEQKP